MVTHWIVRRRQAQVDCSKWWWWWMVSSLQRLFSINHNTTISRVQQCAMNASWWIRCCHCPPAIHVYWVRFSAFLHTRAGTAQVHTTLLPMCTKWWLVAISYVEVILFIVSRTHVVIIVKRWTGVDSFATYDYIVIRFFSFYRYINIGLTRMRPSPVSHSVQSSPPRQQSHSFISVCVDHGIYLAAAKFFFH